MTMNKYYKKNSEWFTKIILFLSLLLLTFIVSLTLRSNPFSQFLPNHDSSMFQYFGYAMKNGRTVYTEIFDHKGPMIFVLNYFGSIFSTPNIQGIYMIEILSLFIYFLFTYKTIRIWLRRSMSFILLLPQSVILMFFLEGGNLTEEFALPFLAISLFIFVKYFNKFDSVNNIEIIFLGFASAAVFSLRANMVVLWLAFCGVIFLNLILVRQFKALIKYTILFLIGLFSFFIPMAIYLMMNGALQEAIFQSLTFNFMYLDTSGDQAEAIIHLYNRLNNHHIILMIGAFFFLVITHWRKTEMNHKFLSIGLILFSVGSYFTSIMSGRDYQHYLMAMIPTVTVPSAILFKKISEGKNNHLTMVSTLILFSLLYYPQLNNQLDNIYVLNTPLHYLESQLMKNETSDQNQKKQKVNQKIINNASIKKQTLDVANVIRQNSEPTDEIYAHRLAGNFYLLSERLSSIKYFNLPAVDINENILIGEDFLNEFMKSSTELVILKNNFVNGEKYGVEKMFFDYVIENYDLIYDQYDHSIYRVFN